MKYPLFFLVAQLAASTALAHGPEKEHWLTHYSKWNPPMGSTFVGTTLTGYPFALTDYLLSPNGFPPEKLEAARQEARILLHEDGDWEDYPNFLDVAEGLWWDEGIRLYDSEEDQARWLVVELTLNQ